MSGPGREENDDTTSNLFSPDVFSPEFTLSLSSSISSCSVLTACFSTQLLDHEVSPDASPQMAIPLDAFVSKAHRPAVATLGESIAIPRPALAAIAGKVKAYYSEPRRGGDARRKQLRREYASQPPLTDFT